MYKNLHKFHISTRQFRIRSGRESIGLGSSRNEQLENERKITELDDRVQKLWEKTYDRIATLQKHYPNNQNQQQTNHASQTSHDQLLYSQGASSNGGATSSMGFGGSLTGLRANNRYMPQDSSISSPRTYSPLSHDEQKLMRLSFSEGYLYGREGKKKTRFRFLARLRDVIFFGLAGLTGFAVFAYINNNREIRRTLLGTKPKEVQPDDIDVRFSDVKGCDESKEELSDVVEYLRNPNKFTKLGGKLPKGILLVGPPGTGKTMLARAVAGEAGVPFFQTSGSEFEEIFVGQGARRIRELFEKAKKQTPCVIFIDEIDSVGGKRTSSAIHPYANQTINQLLNEMDGFNKNEGIIVLGATNRANILDQALLRPGRFDTQVNVAIPEIRGRRELFDYYLRKIRASMDIDLDRLVRTTTGFSGADIQNLINQAALKAAKENMDVVTMEMLEFARDKLIMGPEMKTRVVGKEQKIQTAYHESGHTLVAYYTKKAADIHKVTIISRSRSLGHTAFLDETVHQNQSREQMMARLDTLLGGRIAEQIYSAENGITTGASDDLQKATMLATVMVKEFGMSDKLGLRVIPQDRDVTLSDSMNELIESEINRLLAESKERVTRLLTEHKNELKLLAEALLKYETLDADEIKLVVEGHDPRISHQERAKEKKDRPQVINPQISGPPQRLVDKKMLDLLK